MRPLLVDFRATRPGVAIAQERTLAWLVDAHVEAETSRAGLDAAARDAFRARIAGLVRKVACGPRHIGTRSIAIADVLDREWDRHAIYDLRRHPHGRGSEARTAVYRDIVDAYFRAAYAADATGPDDLIHAACTGYVSPSGAQAVVAARGWGNTTRVTHAYHMGCYAALPAVRIADGFLAAGRRRVDLVHTELCSLHLDPCQHDLEHLVVQSLFADGMIRYAMQADDGRPGLALLAQHEAILPDSAAAMGWIVSDAGMHMTLARDVPDKVGAALRGFVVELCARAGLDLGAVQRAVLAVHPGGPRILDRVRDVLEADEAQLAVSRAVLHDHGNMSSATLPHIWMRILADDAIPRGTLVPSFAFGPGLTVCGALFEKR